MKKLPATEDRGLRQSKAPSPLRSAGALQNGCSRRDFLSIAVAAPLLLSVPTNIFASGEGLAFRSPTGRLLFELLTAGKQLRYRITRANRVAIEPSQLKMQIDGVD